MSGDHRNPKFHRLHHNHEGQQNMVKKKRTKREEGLALFSRIQKHALVIVGSAELLEETEEEAVRSILIHSTQIKDMIQEVIDRELFKDGGSG